MSARKSSHRTIFLIVSSGSPLALIASSLRSTSKKPVCPMTRSLHPPMAHCRQRVRFAATWREEFFEVPISLCHGRSHQRRRIGAYSYIWRMLFVYLAALRPLRWVLEGLTYEDLTRGVRFGRPTPGTAHRPPFRQRRARTCKRRRRGVGT